ncbi:hypothetical protein P8452_34624 [Trifolium repens]|nr:hypothetical protein P8452_34624 [Trifolium repens]
MVLDPYPHTFSISKQNNEVELVRNKHNAHLLKLHLFLQHSTHTLRSQISHLISVSNSKFTLFRFDPKPRSSISNFFSLFFASVSSPPSPPPPSPRIASRRQCRHS